MFLFLKRKNFILDTMLFIVLLVLVKTIVEKQYRKNASTKTRLKYVAQQHVKSLKNNVVDTLSDTFSALAQATKRTERTTDALPEEKHNLVLKSDELLKKLETMYTMLTKEDFPEIQEQELYQQEVKALISKTKHIKQEAQKSTKEAHFLTGPLGTTAQVVHERNLQKKLTDIEQALTVLSKKLHTA